jgi:hypothetical protein
LKDWTKESLRKQLFELLAEGKKVNPKSVENIEGFYSSAKKLFGSYEAFLLDCGLNPSVHFHRNRNLNSIKGAAGLLFEEILGDLLKELKLDIVKETVEGCRPDFIIRTPVNEKWIDAKLTEIAALTSQTIGKYTKHCDKLTLIYLIGEDKDYHITDKVHVASVNRIIDMLESDELKEFYTKRFKLIMQIVNSADKEIRDFGETVDYTEVD